MDRENKSGNRLRRLHTQPVRRPNLLRPRFEQLEDRALLSITQLVADINPVPADPAQFTGNSNPGDMITIGNTVYFTATDPNHGKELWKTDGTAVGTAIVADLVPGTGSSFPSSLTNFNGTLYFKAFTSSGYGLWLLNGSTPTLVPGTQALDVTSVEVAGSVLYFTTDNLLWRVVVGATGPTGVTQLRAFQNTDRFDDVVELTAVGSQLFFAAKTPEYGDELWVTDGTVPGTHLVMDIGTDPSPSTPSEPRNLISFQGKLFFSPYTTASGRELWTSDGTPGGTQIVKDLPGATDLSPNNLTVAGSWLYFSGSDGRGRELWKTNGTDTTELVRDIVLGAGSSQPFDLTAVGGTVYFSALDGSGQELWKSDGTEGGTERVRDIRAGVGSSAPQQLIDVHGTLFFTADDGIHGIELWKSQGTAETTSLVKNIKNDIYNSSFLNSSLPSYITVLSDRIVFAADDGEHGTELWTHILYSVPFVTHPLDDVTVNEGTQPIVIDVGDVFDDLDHQSLTLHVSSTKASLASAVLNGTQLTLTFGPSDGSATITVSATDTDQKTASESFLVWVRPVTLIPTIDPIAEQDVAAALSLRLRNDIGATASTYPGTIHFTSSDPLATLPADYTFTPGDQGVHVFAGGIVLRTLGPQTITMVDTTNSSIVATASVTVVRQRSTLTAGDIDLTFGSLGSTLIGVPDTPSRDEALALAVQPGGNVVVLGRSMLGGLQSPGVYQEGGRTRFTAAGNLQNQTTADTRNFVIQRAVSLPSGKILAQGVSKFGGQSQIAIARYNEDLSFDSTFGTAGSGVAYTGIPASTFTVASVPITTGPPTVTGMDLGPNGEIVLTGVQNNQMAVIRLNANGLPDPQFDGDGIALNSMLLSSPDGNNWSSGSAVTIQSNGKIVATGKYAYTNAGVYHLDEVIARFNQDGSLDTTWGGTGSITASFGFSAELVAVTVQSDGKVVVTGYYTEGVQKFLAARYNVDGTLDSTFSGDGVSLIDFREPGEYGIAASAAAVRQLDDHSILFFNNSLIRLLADGSLDTSYGSGGLAVPSRDPDLITPLLDVSAVVLNSDGSAVFSGTADNPDRPNAGYSVYGVMKLTSAGKFDTSFAGGGNSLAPPHFEPGFGSLQGAAHTNLPDGRIALAAFSSRNFGDFAEAFLRPDGTLDVATQEVDNLLSVDRPRVIAAQPDGKTIIAGLTTNQGLMVVRMTPEGLLDDSFADDGVYANTSLHIAPDAIVVEPNGKMLVAGKQTGGTLGEDRFEILRFNADGTFDLSFGSGGLSSVLVGSGYDPTSSHLAMALQTDGKILVAGAGYPLGTTVIRLESNGNVDPGFGTGGLVRLDTMIGSHVHRFLALDEQQRILIGAGVQVHRLLSSGSRDTTYGVNGIAPANAGGSIAGMQLDADGKITLLGPSDANTVRISRLRPDGAIDEHFGDGGRVEFPFGSSTLANDITVHAGRILVSGSSGSQAFVLAFEQYHHASEFAVSTASTVDSGVASDLQVAALDAFQDVVGNYQGTVYFRSTDPLATLPGDYSFTAADQGHRSFASGVTLVTPGLQTIQVIDAADGLLVGSVQVLVQATTVAWTGNGTNLNWDDPANWQSNSLPGAGNDVVIPDLPGDAVVVIAGPVYVNSLTSGESIVVQGGELTLAADSTISANLAVSSGSVRILGNAVVEGTTSNAGTIEVQNGSLQLTGPVLQIDNGVLSGGHWSLSNAVLDLPSGSAITAIGASATVELSGAVADISQFANSLSVNQGSLLLANGAAIALTDGMTNSGALSLGPGSNLTLAQGASFVQSGGATIVNGTLSAGAIEIQAGTFSGSGTVEGTLLNGAVLAPGNSPGTVRVDGDYQQSAGGSLNLEIAGIDPGTPTGVGTQFDRLIVHGGVSLAGAIVPVLLGSFVPTLGSSYLVIDNDGDDAVAGQFDALPEGNLIWSGRYGFQISYAAGSGNDVALTLESIAAISWDGGGGDFNWSNPLNWSTDTLPGPDDDVRIDFGANDFAVVHSAGSDSIRSLSNSASLAVTGGSLLIAADSTIAGDLSVTATFGGSGNVAVGGLFTWNHGTLQGVNGQGTLTANGGTTISGIPYIQDGFRFFNPVGQEVTWLAGAQIQLRTGGAIINNGFMDIQGDNVMDTNTLESYFENHGTLVKSGGSAVAYLQVPLHNSGTIDVVLGVLLLGYNASFEVTNAGSIHGAAGTTISLPATVTSSGSIHGDRVYFGGPSTVSGSFQANRLAIGGTVAFNSNEIIDSETLIVTGILSGTTTVNVSGLTSVSDNGGFAGSGVLNANGGMEIRRGARFSERTINLSGLTTIASGHVHLSDGVVINLQPGAIWEFGTDDVGLGHDGGVRSTFNNFGTVRKSGTSGGYSHISAIFNNYGSVDVLSGGSFYLEEGGTSTGSFHVYAGSLLNLGRAGLAVGSYVQSAGTIQLNMVNVQGTLDIALGGSLEVGNSDLGPESLVTCAGAIFISYSDVRGVWDVTGTTTFVGGPTTIHPSATVLHIGSDVTSYASVDFSSGDTIYTNTLTFIGGALNGSDTVNVSGLTRFVGSGQSGTGVTNALGGLVLEVGFYHYLFDRTLNIYGNAVLLAGDHEGDFNAIYFDNGVINIHEGATLDVQGDVTIWQWSNLAGALIVNNAGVVRKSAGSGVAVWLVEFNNSGVLDVAAGGVAIASGTTSGSVSVAAGSSFSASGHVFAAGSSLGGDGDVSLYNVLIGGDYDVTGTTAVTSGTTTFAATANVVNLGPLSLNGTIVSAVDLIVSGTLDWQSGWLVGLAGGGSLTLLNNSVLQHTVAVSNFKLINAAQMQWTAGVIQFYGSSAFHNLAGATFTDTFDGTFGSVDGMCPEFVNDGLFVKSGGTGTTYLQMQFVNRGDVQIDEGRVYLSCGYASNSLDPPNAGFDYPGLPEYRDPIVAPLPPGPVTMPGNYTQTTAGTLTIQITGFTPTGEFGDPNSDYGQLVVTGDVTLAGAFSIELPGGAGLLAGAQALSNFAPVVGQMFKIIDNQGPNPIVGQFDHLPEAAIVSGGNYNFQISYVGGDGNDLVLEFVGFQAQAAVVGRYIFYNNSKADGHDPNTGAADDAAAATDKSALLPGGTASFANYTSYSRGINGIMIDVAGLVGTPTASDFTFHVGNDNLPAGWATAPAPTSIVVRPGAGVGGSSRVELIWADGTIKNTWLQITVKATAATGLTGPDVFYFGNAVGESGDSVSHAAVNAADEIGARNHGKTFLDPAALDNLYDFNRDGFVNATDQILARSNSTTLATALKLINVPAGVQSAANVPSLSLSHNLSLSDGSIAAGLAAPFKSPATSLGQAVPQLLSAALASLQADSERQVLLPHALEARRTATLDQNLGVEEDLQDLYELIATDLVGSQLETSQ